MQRARTSGRPGRLDDDIETAGGQGFQFLEGRVLVASREQNGVVGAEVMGELKLVRAGCGDGDACGAAVQEELGEQQAGRASPQDEDIAARSEGQRVGPMDRAGEWLGEDGDARIDASEGEALAGRRDHEFGEAAGRIAAEGAEGRAVEGLPAATVFAGQAGVGVVDGDERAVVETAGSVHNFRHDFVAGDERVGRHEAAREQVLVGATDAREDRTQQHLARCGFGVGPVGDVDVIGLAIDDGAHVPTLPARPGRVQELSMVRGWLALAGRCAGQGVCRMRGHGAQRVTGDARALAVGRTRSSHSAHIVTST